DSAFFFSSRRRHTRSKRDWSSDVCSSDLGARGAGHPPPGLLARVMLASLARKHQRPKRHCTLARPSHERRIQNAPRSWLWPGQRSEERRVRKEVRAGGWEGVVNKKEDI